MKKKRSRKVDKTEPIYMPPKWAWRFAQAFLDPDIKPSDRQVCKAAGISRTTLWEARKDPRLVQWLDDHVTRILGVETAKVRLAHLRSCLAGQEWAIKLWYERYAQFIPSQRHIFEDVSKLNDEQLDQIERILGEENDK